jgi:hypothetical protein
MSACPCAAIVGRAKRSPGTQADTFIAKLINLQVKPEGDKKGLEHCR